jgi:hypothetical protein
MSTDQFTRIRVARADDSKLKPEKITHLNAWRGVFASSGRLTADKLVDSQPLLLKGKSKGLGEGFTIVISWGRRGL